jgi:hypothetical protein
MAEAERLMQLLVHDLRAPLGVATGYLRLLQDGRLPSADDQRFALVRSLDALGRIAHLCNIVSEAGEPVDRSGRVTSEDLAARVAARLPIPANMVRMPGWNPTAEVIAGPDSDRLAEAIALVVGAVAKRTPDAKVLAGTRTKYLRFALGPDMGPEVVRPGAEFDPWRGFGLEVVLACRAISAIRGCVWASDALDVAIDLPFVDVER